MSPADFKESQIVPLIQQLPIDIIERPVKEIGLTDHDMLLGGLMGLLIQLLQLFPNFKQQDIFACNRQEKYQELNEGSKLCRVAVGSDQLQEHRVPVRPSDQQLAHLDVNSLKT